MCPLSLTRQSIAIAAVLALLPLTQTFADAVTDWNKITVDATKSAGLNSNQASRVDAMAAIAVHDAVNSILPFARPYHFITTAVTPASADAAAAQAAHDVLVYFFPPQRADTLDKNGKVSKKGLDSQLNDSLAKLFVGLTDKNNGIAVGAAAAADIIALRAKDGADIIAPPYLGGSKAGEWRPTPIALKSGIDPAWGQVAPFVLPSSHQFRPAPPPPVGSAEYAKALDEVKTLGLATSAKRTAEQTNLAQFFKQDAELTVNEAARNLAKAYKTALVENALIFALVDIAVADARIATWDAKYLYSYWRPVTALNANPDGTVTNGYQAWAPLLDTPPHPSYVSGHSATVSAGLAVLRYFHGDNYRRLSLSTTTKDANGKALAPRIYKRLSQIETDNGLSRIYGGIHYSFDNKTGQVLGRKVAAYVLKHGPHELP